MHRIVRILAAAVLVASVTEAAAQSLTARTVRFHSEALGGQAIFAVLLPPDYDTSGARYPVVYLLHGGTQNHTAFPSRRWFAQEVRGRGVIVVMPHVPPVTYTMAGRGGAPLVQDLIGRDLVSYVDANYRTVPSREARAIGGLSMGGFGAALLGLTRPDLFATVGAFGGAFSGGRERLLADAVADVPFDTAPYFYVACGTGDAVLPASRDFVQLLSRHELPHEYREVPGGHTWDVWDPQTLAFLDVLATRPGFAIASR